MYYFFENVLSTGIEHILKLFIYQIPQIYKNNRSIVNYKYCLTFFILTQKKIINVA